MEEIDFRSITLGAAAEIPGSQKRTRGPCMALSDEARRSLEVELTGTLRKLCREGSHEVRTNPIGRPIFTINPKHYD